MFPNEFDEGMNQLLGVFRPQGFTEDTRAAYFELVKNWSAPDWQATIRRVMLESKFFPKPAELFEIYGAVSGTRDTRLRKEKGFDCERCDGGRIHFLVKSPNTGVYYERYAACDCDAGDYVAQQIVSLAFKTGGSVTLNEVRFSVAAQRYGIATNPVNGRAYGADDKETDLPKYKKRRYIPRPDGPKKVGAALTKELQGVA